ncbi:caspase family protein [Methylocystis sp. S23]
MQLFRTFLAAAAALIAFAAGAGAASGALAAERRLALVVGESAYGAKPLPTAANDAGLVAQTLQAAGFDVTGARDLEETALKQTFRDFLDKAGEAGPDAVVFVYFSGYGLQLEGENYLVPVDARLARDADIPLRTLRVSDYLKPLAASGAKLGVVVLDVARANPYRLAGQPLAGGLALYEPGGRTLLAYNAAPGAVAPEATGDYGPYAHALAEMIRDGGAPLTDVFENTRLRVSEMTKGAQIPWNSQEVQTDFLFFQRDANAPARVADASLLAQPIKALGPEAGFSAAIRRDTLDGYQDYVATYPAAPHARRARAFLAARREALIWRRSRVVDTPNAYWTYLRRYPKGPHAWDARRRLAELRYEPEPPPRFEMIDYDYPPPPPEELVFVERPAVYFDDPSWGFAPPPPPPAYFLPPPPPDFVVLPPPVVIAQPYVLPAPHYVPIPAWQRTPDHVAPPPDNFIYANAHNAVVIDPRANNVVARDPAGGVVSTGALTAAGVGAAAVAVGAALPNFIAKRNAAAPANAPPPMGAPAGALDPARLGQPPLTPATSLQNPPPPPAMAPATPEKAGAARAPIGVAPPPQAQPGTPPLQGPRPPRPPIGARDGHALPAPRADEGVAPPPDGQPLPARPARAGRAGGVPDAMRGVSAPPGEGAAPTPSRPAAGGASHPPPAATLAPNAPIGKAASPVGTGRGDRASPAAEGAPSVPASPLGGATGARRAPAEAGAPREAGPDRNGAIRPRPAPTQGFDSGASGAAPHRAIERPTPAPLVSPQMRETPASARMRDSSPPRAPADPSGALQPPRQREAPAPGMAPQMRGAALPAMRPPPDRGPPGGTMRQPPPQAAPAMMRPPAPAPRPSRPEGGGHGGPGGPPGFGGPR